MSQPSVRKRRREKAVKTERKRTKKIKEELGEKKAQREKKKTGAEKAGEKALEQKAKEEALKNEALDFCRQLKERGLTPFDGASIDFHRKRDPVVFIPRENPMITAVRKEELLDFLEANNVRKSLSTRCFRAVCHCFNHCWSTA